MIDEQITDEKLVEQIKGGDEESLNILIKAYLPKVYGRVHNLVPEADAEDVTQDIFLSLVDSIHSFRGKSTFNTWFHRITMNKVADYHRKSSRRKEQAIDNQPPRAFNPWTEADDILVVREVLMELSEKYREVLLLKFSEGLQFGEIAERLNLSYEATRSRYRRAVEACREEMDRHR